MLKVDARELQKIKDHFVKRADQEIAMAKASGAELSHDDINAIHSRNEYEAQKRIEGILLLGPEKVYKLGFALSENGWRAGYTKPTIEKRKQERREKNKRSRQARKENKKK